MAISGSVQEVSIAGRPFSAAADADGSRGLGGLQTEVQMNGNGTSRNIKTRVPWEVSGLSLSIDDGNDDQEFLQGVADGTEVGADEHGNYAISFTLMNDMTYTGRGTIVDGVAMSTQNATAGLTFRGSGKLKRQ